MHFEHLTLEGFRAFIEREEIDLSKSELTLIDGPNGAGKTTIFEAITFALYAKYRTSSINGVISRGKKKATVELIFTIAGSRYKVVRTKTKKEHEAYLYVEDPDADEQWISLSEKNPGVSTDKQLVETIGMDYPTALMTWIMDQDSKGDICELAPANRRAGLIQGFGLTGYKAREEKAKARRDDAEKRLKKEAGALETLEERQDEIENGQGLPELTDLTDLQLERKLEDSDARNEEITSLLAVNLDDRDALQEAIDTAKSDIAEFEAAHQSQVQAHREKVQFKRNTYQQAQQGLESLSRSIQQAQQSVAVAQRNKQAAVAHVEQAQERLNESTNAGWGISGLEAQIEEATTRLSAKENAIANHENSVIPTAEKARDSQREAIAAMKQNQEHIKATGVEINQRKESLQRKAGECFTCGQPLDDAARTQIHHDYDQKSQQLRKDWAQVQEEIKHAEQKLKESEQSISTMKGELSTFRREAQQIQSEISGLRNQHANMKAIADDYQNRLQTLDRLKAGLSDYDEQIRTADEQVTQAQEAVNTKQAEVQPLREAFEEAQKAPEPAMDQAKMSRLRAALTAAEQNLANSANAEQTRAQLRVERDAIRKTQQNIWAEQERRKQRAAALKEIAGKIKAAQKGIESLQKEYDTYALLTQAYSPSGIPSMILAGLIDKLNEYTNMALSALGMDYGVEITTQKENSRGKLTDEKVMIYVTTPEGTDEYASLSGSEKLRVRIALREGLMMCMEAQSGTPINTFLWDEIWAPLDVEKKELMVGEAVRLAEDYRIFTISHEPQVKESIPYVISVDNADGTARTSQYVR